MAQLCKRFALNLANTLTGNAKFAAHFLERMRVAIFQAEAQANNLALTFGQTVKYLGKLLLEHREARSVRRHDSRVVFNEIAQLRVFLFADRRLERNRLLADFLDFAHAFGGQTHFSRQSLPAKGRDRALGAAGAECARAC